MNLLKALLLCLMCFAGSVSHATNNYQDWWWNPAQSGMGLNVGQQDTSLFVAWFNYGDDTKASFLTLGGVLSGNTLTGTLYRGTGPVPGPNYNPAQVKQTAVGTATLTFNSNTDAILTYSYDNKSGSIPLQRFSFANPNFNQTWTVIDTYTQSGCANPAMNESVNKAQMIRGQKGSGSNFTFTVTNLDNSNMCVAAMNFQSAGSKLNATGTASCEGGTNLNVAFEDIAIQSDYLTFSYTATGFQDAGLSCIQKGNMAGVVKKDTVQSYDIKTAYQNRLLKGFSKNFNISGDCTGTFAKTDSPAVKTTWNGKSVYAVGSTEIINAPNCVFGLSGIDTFTSYYDLNFVELARTYSSGEFSDFVSTAQPSIVRAGDTGSLGTWSNWTNSSKLQKNDIDVSTYIVEPESATSVIVNRIERTYDNANVLKKTIQIKSRLTTGGDFDWVSATIDISTPKGHLVFQ